MVDQLQRCDEQGASTTFAVREDNIFVEQGQLTEPALIENIAQTAAARMGYLCDQEQKPVPVGFIGAVQHLKITGLPQIADILKTSITIKNQIFNATIIEGAITVNETRLVSCEMKIFIS